MRKTSGGIVRVTAAILEKKGRIIIARRAAGDRLAGKWELPGGKVENGESPEQCLARELQEEFNLLASVGDCVGSRIHHYDHMSIELLVYRAAWSSGEPVALAHAEFRWVFPGDLQHYEFAPADLPFVRKLESGEIDIRSSSATR